MPAGSLPAARAALLLRALGDRRTPEATAALVAAAAKGAKETRLAALESLGAAGDASAIAVLLGGAEDADAEVARAATASLSSLSGAEVDAEIKKRLPQAKGKILPMLLELVGQRRIDAIPPALEAVGSQDPATRAAALAALGNIVDVERLPVLVKAVTAPRDAADAANAKKALLTAAIRMPDREACAGAIAGPLATAPAEAREVLLETLGQVGSRELPTGVPLLREPRDRLARQGDVDHLGLVPLRLHPGDHVREPAARMRDRVAEDDDPLRGGDHVARRSGGIRGGTGSREGDVREKARDDRRRTHGFTPAS